MARRKEGASGEGNGDGDGDGDGEAAGHAYDEFETLLAGNGYDGEPLVDVLIWKRAT